jgi:drug/metabolite transporter (DMT)-like permease
MDLTRKGPGYLAVLISAATWATPGIFIRFKHLTGHYHPLTILTYGFAFAALDSFLFLGERPAPIQCIGALAVVVGVVALNLRKIHPFRKLRKSPRCDLWPRHGRLLEQTAYQQSLPAERPLHCPSS